MLYEYQRCNREYDALAPLSESFTVRRTIGSPYIMSRVTHTVEAGTLTEMHSYVLSEDRELVKVTPNGYEYTGMYVED